MNNRDRVIELITQYELERREVAEMVKVKRETVDRWLLPNEAANHEDVSDMAIELLQLKIRDRFPDKPLEGK